LPSGPREGIVVNLGDLHLYYFEKGTPPRAYPIGIAKDGYATPLGETEVKAKREKPTWVPGESARRDDPKLPRAIEPGPDNPLGEYALYLGWPAISSTAPTTRAASAATRAAAASGSIPTTSPSSTRSCRSARACAWSTSP
jgi:lipoprotein-anchoring transpeptidase ErfK/SrfK